MKKEIQIREWWNPGGGMMYNTYALDPDHDMHPYNQAIAQGVVPEEYGIENPYKEIANTKYKEYTKERLVGEIIKLKKEISAMHAEMARWY